MCVCVSEWMMGGGYVSWGGNVIREMIQAKAVLSGGRPRVFYPCATTGGESDDELRHPGSLPA